MSALDQAVILCGGRGTRMAPLMGNRPKVLVEAGGHSLLDHLLADLASAGVRQALLLAGPNGREIADSVARTAPRGLDVHTIIEPAPRGTAGALAEIADRLAERFLVVYGDVFTSLDWRRFAETAEQNGGLGTLVVHRSDHPEDSDLVALDDTHRLIGWVGRSPGQRQRALTAAAALTNAGVAVLHRDILRRIPLDRPSDLTEQILPALIDARAPLWGYVTSEFVRDAGTPKRLEQVQQALLESRVYRRAELCFIDRDGVLTEGLTPPTTVDEVRLLPGSAQAIGRLNRAGIEVIVTTNQGGVARGLYTEETLHRIHRRVEELLAAEGARLDGWQYCPHHPETHWKEGDPALRGPCLCRKPSTAMIDRALERSRHPAWRAVVVGDETTDLQLAMNAGLPGIAVDTGHGGKDGRFPARATWRFSSLSEAAEWLCGPDPKA